MNRINKIIATRSFERSIKKLQRKHNTRALKEIYDVVTDLANFKITTQKSNHRLENAEGHRDIHINGGDLILLYRYDSSDEDDVILVIDLRLQDVVNHDQLKNYDKYDAPATEYDINNIKASTDFFDWYDSLDDEAQEQVDDISDRNAIPLYTEASEEELNWIKHLYESEYNHIEPIESASYGGAYDIEDDMFFTKDEIVEWADKVADEFNINNNARFQVADVYFTDPTELTVELDDGDYTYVATVNIDMRRINKPSDIDKYIEPALNQLQMYYDESNSSDIQSSTIIASDETEADSDDDSSMQSLDAEDKVEESRNANFDVITFNLDTIVDVDDGGNITYQDDSYDWLDADTNPGNGPIELDTIEGVAEKVLELIEGSVPINPGSYHVTGVANLYYEITGIESDITDVWEDGEHGRDYNVESYVTDETKVEYSFRDSNVDDLTVEQL